ncbi:hypothetical protein [Streptomyces xiaopingdaonensis]|uniref:hypothetical protein n=1 Tax=Streptomyces xiaopingdaonensis TaxID=1565415 RepID=UPI0003030E28|nr:hypothetical protein [Streptomyces xiaopingdaonensis]
MLTSRRADLPTVRCDLCPDHPVLPTHEERHNHQLCARCQQRLLAAPHPDDHLCAPCRRECPDCHAPTPEGTACRTCRGRCRTCRAPLPRRPAPADELVTVAPEGRSDRSKWAKTYFPRSSTREQCDACRAPRDPARTVLAALPEPLLRACGGALPPTALDVLHAELRTRTPAELINRIGRRWWTSWAHRPLRAEEPDEEHRPDTVLTRLLAPTPCNGRCEDGWHRADPGRPDEDDRPCPVCRGGRLLRATPEHDDEEHDEPSEGDPRKVADRPLSEALADAPPFRECEGRDGACGLPVADPYPYCPACLGWPRCSCGRRFDPERADGCRACGRK